MGLLFAGRVSSRVSRYFAGLYPPLSTSREKIAYFKHTWLPLILEDAVARLIDAVISDETNGLATSSSS